MSTRGACALVVVAATGLCGCSVERRPVVNIKPSYSIMRDTVALEDHMGGPGGGRGVAVAGADDRLPEP